MGDIVCKQVNEDSLFVSAQNVSSAIYKVAAYYIFYIRFQNGYIYTKI